MARFLWGVAVGVVIAILVSVVLLLAIGRFFSHKQPTVAGDSVLVLNLEGDLPEANSVEFSIPFVQSEPMPTIRDVWASLHEAANDKRIKAVVLQPRDLSAGWGKLQELYEDLAAYKKSGKPLYAFLQGPGSHEYYLASLADKIYVSPDDMVNLKGFAVESYFFKNALDKLGVSVQVDHIGTYKDAGDAFTRTGMSNETREVLNQVVDQIYSDFCARVGQGRHKSGDEVRSLLDNGPFVASQSKTNGLVDELGYEDQVYSDLKKRVGAGELKKISIRTYAQTVPAHGDHIALIVGQGEITGAAAGGAVNSDTVISAPALSRIIRRVREDSSVKGVIFRVDSPGGDSVASDELLHEMQLLSRAKPVVISMSDLAASGGYFISMTGDPILAYPDTITGSIGVLYIRPNGHDLLNKLGVGEDVITRGKLADMDMLGQPLSDAARQKLHDSIQSTYQSFVGKVALARRRNYGQIEPLAQGRVWMGAQAKQNGLVDELGGLDRAVATVRQRAKLSASGQTNLVVYPPRRSLLEVLMGSNTDNAASAAMETRIRRLMPMLPSETLLRGGKLAILPFQFVVH